VITLLVEYDILPSAQMLGDYTVGPVWYTAYCTDVR